MSSLKLSLYTKIYFEIQCLFVDLRVYLICVVKSQPHIDRQFIIFMSFFNKHCISKYISITTFFYYFFEFNVYTLTIYNNFILSFN